MMILHHHPLCALSRVARLVLGEKKLEFTQHVEKPWEQCPEFLALSATGDLPLLLDEGHVVVKGLYPIVEYLGEVYPDVPLLPGSAAERAHVRWLVSHFNDSFYDNIVHTLVKEKLFKRLMIPQQEPDSRLIRAAYHGIHAYMDRIGALSERHTWLGGDSLSLADLSVAAQLSCVDYLGDIPWDQHPIVKDWYARVKSRPSFRSLLGDRVSGIPPARHYAILDF